MTEEESLILEILRVQHMAISALASVVCGNDPAAGTVVGCLITSQNLLKKNGKTTPNMDSYLQGYLVDTAIKTRGNP